MGTVSLLIPEDGIVVCSRCGRQVDLKQRDAAAYQCERHPDCVFCSQTCLREHVLGDCDEDV